jgi:hypothetical protein
MLHAAQLTASDLTLLRSIWPAGRYSADPVNDVFSFDGSAGHWALVARRQDGSYVLVDGGGTVSRSGASLAAVDLPGQPGHRQGRCGE